MTFRPFTTLAAAVLLVLASCSDGPLSPGGTGSSGPSAWEATVEAYSGVVAAVWGTPSGEVYAAGSIVARYDGRLWYPQELPTSRYPQSFRTGWGTAPDDIYITDYERIHHWNGTAWDFIAYPAGEYMWGALSGEIFVTDWSRRVVHRFDGSSWQLDTLATNSRLSGVWGSSASDVYVAGERGLIAHYDGTRWTTSTIDSMLYIAKAWRVGSGPLRVLMGPGRIYEFNGALAPLGPEVDLRVLDLWPQGPHAFVAAGYLGDGSSGVAYRFDGSAWSEIARTPNDLRSAWSSATGDVYVAGKGVWRHQDGETEKVLGAKGPSGTIYDFWRAPTGEIIAVGSRAYRYDERGWTDLEMGSLSGNTTFAVHGRSADDFYAVGNQTVLHYRKGTWDWVGTGFQSNLRGVSVDGSDVTVVGWDTGGTISRFDGTQWTRMESNTSRRLYDIWGWADGAIAVGEEGTILRFDGVEWRPETSPVTFNLRQVLGFGPNRIIATGDSSSEIVLYDGRVWKAVTTTMTGDATAWNTSLWGTSLNDLFIAQDEGLVYHFDGKAWSLLSPLLMHRANAIVGLPDGDVLVTGDETVLRYHPRSAR